MTEFRDRQGESDPGPGAVERYVVGGLIALGVLAVVIDLYGRWAG